MQISRSGLMIWIGLTIIVAAWMFSLGVLVGRGTIPVPATAAFWKSELAERKAKALRHQQETAENQAPDQIGKADLGFYEKLKEPLSENDLKITPEPDSRAKPETAAGVSKATAPAAAGKAGSAASAPLEAKKDGAVRSGGFAIQVAALKEAGEADALVAKLKAKGCPAYQVAVENKEGKWYRVRIGAFQSRAEAATMLRKVQTLKLNGIIVQNP